MKSKKGGSRFDFINNKQIVKSKRSTRALMHNANINLVASKRSQVTIFIIIAVVIVAVLLLVFNAQIRTSIKQIFVSNPPNIQLQNCIQTKLDEAVGIVSKQGGSIQPVNSMMYQGNEVEYLCYTNQYYQTCINQQPLLKQHIERELLNYIRQDIQKCISNLKQDLISKGYSISQGNQDISLNIVQDNIKIIVSGFSVSKQDTAESFNKFELSYKSRLYNLIMITNSILNWEARYGDSDITTYMLYYPNIKVEKYKQEDGSKIYILTDNNDKFVFATRSLSWPAGYGIGLTYKPIAG